MENGKVIHGQPTYKGEFTFQPPEQAIPPCLLIDHVADLDVVDLHREIDGWRCAEMDLSSQRNRASFFGDEGSAMNGEFTIWVERQIRCLDGEFRPIEILHEATVGIDQVA